MRYTLKFFNKKKKRYIVEDCFGKYKKCDRFLPNQSLVFDTKRNIQQSQKRKTIKKTKFFCSTLLH